MHTLVEMLLWVGSVAMVMAHRRPFPEGSEIIMRGSMPDCRPREVCADIFTAPRTQIDGSMQMESRVIQNCVCKGTPSCGFASNPLIFNETRKQSMTTCEDASLFLVCEEGQVVKEQHNILTHVYHKINCVCPNNHRPQGFFSRMTERIYSNDLPEMLRPAPYSRDRFYACRDF